MRAQGHSNEWGEMRLPQAYVEERKSRAKEALEERDTSPVSLADALAMVMRMDLDGSHLPIVNYELMNRESGSQLDDLR